MPKKSSAADFPGKETYLWIPLLYAIATFSTYSLIAPHRLLGLKALGIAIFLVTFPSLLRRFLNLTAGLIVSLSFLVLCGLILRSFSGFIIFPLAGIALACTLRMLIKDRGAFAHNRLTIVGIIFFAFINFAASSRLHVPYISFRSMVDDIILPGIMDTDAAFHMAIVNMVRNVGIPSTGLHGTPFLHYHWLGYYIWAGICNVMNVPIYDAYYFVNPFITFPVLLVFFQAIITELNGDIRYLGLLPLIFYGFSYIPESLWNRGFDNTYPVGLFFGLACVVLCLRRVHFILQLVCLALTYFGKVSVGMIASGFLGLYCLFFRDIPISRRLLRTAGIGLASMLSLLAVYRFTDRGPEGPLFDVMAFFHREGGSHSAIYFLFEHSYIFILLVLVALLARPLIQQRLEARTRFALGCILVSALLFFLLGFNMNHSGGSQFFFLNPLQWLCIPFLIVGCQFMLDRSSRWRKPTLVVLVGIGLWTGFQGLNVGRSYASYQRNFSNRTTQYIAYYHAEDPERETKFMPYFKALSSIPDFDRANEYAIEIPESETDFWKHSIYPEPRIWMSFYIPAISGRPAWNAYNYRTMKNKAVAWYPPGLYGFSDYYGRDIDDICQIHQFKGLIRIQRNAQGQVERRVFDCTSQGLIASKTRPTAVF